MNLLQQALSTSELLKTICFPAKSTRFFFRYKVNAILRILILICLTSSCHRTPPEELDHKMTATLATNATVTPVSISSPLSTALSRPSTGIPLLETYSGFNSIRGENNFTLQYEAAKWRYEDGEPFGQVLVNLDIAHCFLLLKEGGRIPSTPVGEINLAERQWTILQPESTNQRLYRSLPFEFQVYFSSETSNTEDKNACHRDVEAVLSHFQSTQN